MEIENFTCIILGNTNSTNGTTDKLMIPGNHMHHTQTLCEMHMIGLEQWYV